MLTLPYHTVSVAPMMGCTDRHFRYMARLFSPTPLLYTEMISAAAIIHGNQDALLEFHPREHPLALQIGSGDADACARAVEIAERYGYDEYNLNVGCPSPKVRCGMFGAQLMGDSKRVATIVRAMKSATRKPVTVKHRLGIDPRYERNTLREFCETVAQANPDRLIIHARIALLDGLSPKENRTVPPIMYEEVHYLKRHLPDIAIEINGAIATLESIRHHLSRVDGVMIGREIYRNPTLLLDIEREIFRNRTHTIDSAEVVRQMGRYIDECENAHIRIPLHRMGAHLSALYYRQPQAKRWRRALHNEIARTKARSSTFACLRQALHAAYQGVSL